MGSDDDQLSMSNLKDMIDKMLSNGSPSERVQAFLDMTRHPKYNFYDRDVLQGVKLVAASEGRTEFEFTVTPAMCNSSGTLHGGCAATMLDDLTSLPGFTIAKPGFLDAGTMSRTLTCTYQRALKAGEKVKVVCEVVSAGKTMSHYRGEMIDQDGRVAVSCIHDKVSRARPKL